MAATAAARAGGALSLTVVLLGSPVAAFAATDAPSAPTVVSTVADR